jgi:hypothetical protein
MERFLTNGRVVDCHAYHSTERGLALTVAMWIPSNFYCNWLIGFQLLGSGSLQRCVNRRYILCSEVSQQTCHQIELIYNKCI